ncbi:uncharacterized [Tachysurus ichikawai]
MRRMDEARSDEKKKEEEEEEEEREDRRKDRASIIFGQTVDVLLITVSVGAVTRPDTRNPVLMRRGYLTEGITAGSVSTGGVDGKERRAASIRSRAQAE